MDDVVLVNFPHRVRDIQRQKRYVHGHRHLVLFVQQVPLANRLLQVPCTQERGHSSAPRMKLLVEIGRTSDLHNTVASISISISIYLYQ